MKTMLKYVGIVASILFIAPACTNDDSTDDCIDQSSISGNTCFEVYNPVCGCDGFTYSNTCFAMNAGLKSWTPGPCEDDCIGPPGILQLCTTDYDPVCGCDGITYTNECMAQVRGVKRWTSGVCNNTLCDTYGTVVQSINEGCNLVIRLDNGSVLQPIFVPSDFTLMVDQRIKFSYDVIDLIDNTCVGAEPVDIDCIQLVNTTPCNPILPLTSMPSGMDDALKIKTASIVGDCLNITVQYSGGCAEQVFELYQSFSPTVPASFVYDLELGHDAKGDLCEALIIKDVSFDLASLQVFGTSTVTLSLHSAADPSYSQTLSYTY